MDFNQTPSGLAELGGDLAYDLRQTYAKIVGEHLQDIALARKADRYSIYYKSLRDLFVIVKHKFRKKKIKDVKTGKEKTELEIYDELMKKAVLLANENRNEWLGVSKDSKACANIEEALNDIEMFLYEKIDDAKMFGSSGVVAGL